MKAWAILSYEIPGQKPVIARNENILEDGAEVMQYEIFFDEESARKSLLTWVLACGPKFGIAEIELPEAFSMLKGVQFNQIGNIKWMCADSFAALQDLAKTYLGYSFLQTFLDENNIKTPNELLNKWFAVFAGRVIFMYDLQSEAVRKSIESNVSGAQAGEPKEKKRVRRK